MATTAQTFANRENAKNSTGPTTESGKATSSRNGLKHGLTSTQFVIQAESEDEFKALLAALTGEHQPQTITETLLVQDMAKYHWLTDRAIALQSEVLSAVLRATGQIAPQLGVLIRYQTANERAFQKSLATLTALQKARKSAPHLKLASLRRPPKHPTRSPRRPTPRTLPPWNSSSPSCPTAISITPPPAISNTIPKPPASRPLPLAIHWAKIARRLGPFRKNAARNQPI